MNSRQHAFAIVAAVSRLHAAGYGRLRILCYVVEGLGVWRHQLFASDGFSLDDAPKTKLCSLPDWGIAKGVNSRVLASVLLRDFPKLMVAAKGPIGDYAFWLRKLLLQHPGAVLEMQEPEHALIGMRPVVTPFFGQRPDATFAVHYSKVLLDSLGPFPWNEFDPQWLRIVQERVMAHDQDPDVTLPGADVFAVARSIVQ